MALFSEAKAPFFRTGSRAIKHNPLICPLLCRLTFLAPGVRKMAGAIFERGPFSTGRAEAVDTQTLRILGSAAATIMA